MEREYCVYMHRFPNGKVYIGQTCQKPEQRWSDGRGYKGCSLIESAIKKYGWENVGHIILRDHLNSDEADKWERFFIDEYKSNQREYGYNLRTGGTTGYRYTEEARSKMSKVQTGKKQSEETCKKHSEALRRYYSSHQVSEETREKLRKAATERAKNRAPRKPMSEETKKKISEALKGRDGRPLTEAEKKHLSEVAKCRPATVQRIANIAPHQFKQGHPPSEKSMQTLKEKLSKPVVQYDKGMNYIDTYPSIGEASKAIGMTINAVGNAVRGYVKTAGGYVWRYAE